MIYIYRRNPSDSALVLADAIGGLRFRNLDRLIRHIRPADRVICWGESYQSTGSERILNGGPIRNKYTDAVVLTNAGVPTIQIALQKPQDAPERTLAVPAGDYNLEQVKMLQMGIYEWLRLDAVEPTGLWLARRNSHVGGNDLLADYGFQPDYWVKKESIVREYRVHSFLGRSIRSGVKIPRAGIERPHEWIRSWDAGWMISYDGQTCRQRHRDLAHQAVSALGLQFGAVDIGERGDGSLVVFEVNRAPGLMGGTVMAYAEAIRRWAEGDQV